MCKKCINYFNGKVLYSISLIINIISGILLIVWNKDSSKTAIINAIDKVIHTIIDIFALLKDESCHKQEIKEADKPDKEDKADKADKEMSPVEKGTKLLQTVTDGENIINELNNFIVANKDTANTKRKEEVENAEALLIDIKRKAEKMINNININ